MLLSNYVSVLRSFANFTGRAGRREYWSFVLVNLLIVLAAEIPIYVLDLLFGWNVLSMLLGIAVGIFALVTLVPSIAALVRRLHDTGRTGWWVLVALVPVIGGLALLVLSVLEGTPGPNRYGPDPKSVASASTAYAVDAMH
ncbi:MAG: DUF805 domain-containing protein [Vulcanimicrobiaceae bacterium]